MELKILEKKIDEYFNKIKTNRKNNIDEDPIVKWEKIIKKDKMVKKETIKNFMRVKFTMNNTIFKVPLYPQDPDTPLVKFFFNMIYDQEWNNKYENIYTLPNKKILETNYIIQDSILLPFITIDVINIREHIAAIIEARIHTIFNLKDSVLMHLCNRKGFPDIFREALIGML
jgi:hypothetical protein